MNDKVERMWKKADIAYVKVLSQHMPWVAENHKRTQVSNFPVLYSKPGPSQYKAGVETSSP
jgi:hypothetical protein